MWKLKMENLRLQKGAIFVEKRGHIKKNCPSKQRYWKWMEEQLV